MYQCFPILYTLTISMKPEESSIFFVVLYAFFFYIFQGTLSAKLDEKNSFVKVFTFYFFL